MRLLFPALLGICAASAAFAVGSDDDDIPPTPTETTTDCTDAQIYDPETQSCVDADQQSFNDDTRYDAVRELAYAGKYQRATSIIDAADAPQDPRFLNYRGYIARQMGNSEQAMVFYQAALTKAPDYHLARSYMGQGLVTLGDLDGATDQLREISARGGKNTWAYFALKQAISSGVQSGY